MHAHVKGLAGYHDKKGGGGSRKRKDPNCLLKRVSASSVMNPHMKWERGSAVYFFNRCYNKKSNLVLWSHFYKNKMRTILFQNETSSLRGVKCLMWKPQWTMYIFFLPISSCSAHPDRLEWTSHFGSNSFSFTSVSCRIDVSSFHTQDFCSYSVFTNLRYRTIQEHVVILLSNNCAVFVVHFWPVFDITSMPWHEDLI